MGEVEKLSIIEKTSESKQEKVEIESIGEILDINESEDQTKGPVSDSFINETNNSLEKQNSSQIDEKSSIEKDIDEGSAPEASIKNIHTSSEKENSSQIDEELSVEKEETGDTAPDSFINDIYTSEGKQSGPKQESEVSEFKSGALKIIVHKAAELVNQDRFGKSDPYVIVKYRDKEFRSKTINNTLEPAWNFTSEFDIVEIDDSPIDIEVYDDDFGKDSSEGSYSLTLDEAINDLVVEGKWYNLEGCKTGKIFISTIYVSKDDEEHDEKDAQDESEGKEESGSSRVNEEIEELPTENDKISDKQETSSKSDTSGLGAVEVKDMFTLLKEIPHTHETDTSADKPSKSDEVDIEAGILSLIIHKASQLENLDIVGKSDPFVKIKFNDLEFKSKSVRNTLEPEWNFSNDLVISENQNGNIDITVYDSDIGKDSIEGSYSFPLKDAIQMSGKEGSWYNLTGCKSGEILITSKFAKNDTPSVGDDVDGPSSMNEEICDNEEVIDEKSVKVGQNKMEIPSIRKEGENIDDSIDDEDTDKQDDDVSESDYSYVTVADLSRKEDISQSEADDQNKLPKDKEVKSNDEKNQEDESPSKETPKGFMASIKDTVGGYFYSDKSTKEDIKEEEQGSQDLVSSEKEVDKPDPHVPREFLMQPTSQDANNSSSSLLKKQPINLKDDNETIMEEAEPVEETADETIAVVTMKSSQSDTPKEEPKEEKKKDDSLKKKAEKEPAVVKMVTCHSEALHEEQKDEKEEEFAVVEMVTCHSEADSENTNVTDEKNETPAVVEMVTCHSDVVDTETTEEPSSPTKSEANMKESKINLPFSPTSVQPREPYP